MYDECFKDDEKERKEEMTEERVPQSRGWQWESPYDPLTTVSQVQQCMMERLFVSTIATLQETEKDCSLVRRDKTTTIDTLMNVIFLVVLNRAMLRRARYTE